MVHGDVNLDTFNHLPDRDVAELANRIAWQPMRDAAFPHRFEAAAECRLRSGVAHSVRVDDAYGNAGRPPTQEEIMQKFRANAGLAIPMDAADALAIEIMAIDRASDLARLGQLFRCDDAKQNVRTSGQHGVGR
jgi:hypothetical protein